MRRPPPENDATPLAGRAGVNATNFHQHDSDSQQLVPLAEELGVSVSSLVAIGFRRESGEWRNPERNAEGEIISWSRRLDSGRKRSTKGSKRGLTLSYPLKPYAGTSRDNPIVIVEGASDTAAGLDLGFDTVGRPSAFLGVEFLRMMLKGLHAVVVAENDKAGWKGADKIVAALADVTASIRVVLPPKNCKDLRAWLQSGDCADIRSALHSAIESAETIEPDETPICKDTKRATPIMRRASEIEPEEIEWLWPGRIPIGKISIIAGDPGVGKSFLMIDMIARATGGWTWPGEGEPCPCRMGVVLYNAEDDPADTIRPRLDASEADPDRVTILEGVRHPDCSVAGFTLADIDVLEQAIDDTPDCGLVVIDPIGAVFGDANSHRDSDVRALMAPLSVLAARKRVAIVLVHRQG